MKYARRLTGLSISGIEWTKEDWLDLYRTLRAFKLRFLRRHEKDFAPHSGKAPRRANK